jgi:hypothetical protein
MENNTNNQAPPKNSSSMWTLSYRLQGLTLGLIAALVYCYFYLGFWHKYLIIAAGIAGYFLGWVAGKFTYRSGR